MEHRCGHSYTHADAHAYGFARHWWLRVANAFAHPNPDAHAFAHRHGHSHP
jgi:hypothetical protein